MPGIMPMYPASLRVKPGPVPAVRCLESIRLGRQRVRRYGQDRHPATKYAPGRGPIVVVSQVYQLLRSTIPFSQKDPELIRLGSRSSRLATWQAEYVQSRLEAHGIEVEIVFISTEGDQSTQSLREFGGQGAFTKRIQQALLAHEIDFAVHSLKDLPTEKVDGLTLAAVPTRENPVDVWVSNRFASLEAAEADILVGTGSLRRQAQLLHYRADIRVADIRGNVETRLKKMDDGEYDAIVLARAGLTRLGLDSRIRREFQVTEMLPAIGQGALGLECREDDQQTRDALQTIEHPESRQAVMAERSLLRELRAGCLAPVGAHARINPAGQIELSAAVLSQDGQQKVDGFIEGASADAEQLGIKLAGVLIAQGADRLLKR